MFDKDIINNNDINSESINNENSKNEDVTNEDITSKNNTSEDITSEDIVNEDITSENIVNEDIVSEDVVSEDIENEDIENEDIVSENMDNGNNKKEDIEKKDIKQEDIKKEDIKNGDDKNKEGKMKTDFLKVFQWISIVFASMILLKLSNQTIRKMINKRTLIGGINESTYVYLKWIGIAIVFIILLLLSIRAVGKSIYKRIPVGGINESMYVDINNTKQWISIYGQDINNPVILYLHGGPGGASSYFDYGFLRKWSDIYTVVSWDQRDCGLSYKRGKEDIPYTHELFMQDGLEMTKFLTQYLHKDKIILIGHSWGTAFGSNLSLNYPEYYQYYIGTGQIIDMKQNEKAFVEAAKEWSKGDKKGEELASKLDVNNRNLDYYITRQKIMSRYGYQALAEKPDYNLLLTIFFNPYYSLFDLLKLVKTLISPQHLSKYMNFLSSDEFDKFSLLNRTDFPIPFYNILGDHDYQTNRFQAEEYFNSVNAPRKKLYMMKDMNHGLLQVRSGEFSDLMHDINKLEQAINSKSTTTN